MTLQQPLELHAAQGACLWAWRGFIHFPSFWYPRRQAEGQYLGLLALLEEVSQAERRGRLRAEKEAVRVHRAAANEVGMLACSQPLCDTVGLSCPGCSPPVFKGNLAFWCSLAPGPAWLLRHACFDAHIHLLLACRRRRCGGSVWRMRSPGWREMRRRRSRGRRCAGRRGRVPQHPACCTSCAASSARPERRAGLCVLCRSDGCKNSELT